MIPDQMGREIELPAEVTRVVSLAPSVTEILYALGAGELLVGRDSFSNYPAEAAEVPSVGTNYEPSLERILGLRPDVVFTATTANLVETVEAMERFSLSVFATRSDDLEELAETIRVVGRVVGRQDEADELLSQIERRLERVRVLREEREPVPALLVVWNDPLYVVGRETYTAELLDLAGGTNVAADAGAGFPKYSLERVLKRGPAVILIGSHEGPEGDIDPREYWRRWPTLPAVENDRILKVDGDLVFRPGPRVVEGVWELMRALHPDLREEKAP